MPSVTAWSTGSRRKKKRRSSTRPGSWSSDAAEIIRRHARQGGAAGRGRDRSLLGPREPLRVLGYAVNGGADEVALAMLAQLLDDLPIVMEITGTRMQAAGAGGARARPTVLGRVLR